MGDTWNMVQLPHVSTEQFYSILAANDDMVFMHVDDPGVKRKKEADLRLRKQGLGRALEVYKVARKELKNGFRRARRGYKPWR
eukprot:g42923.t1